MGEQKNRRGSTRVALQLQVEVEARGSTLHGLVTGNLSMGGVLLRSPETLPKGTPCRLRIPAGPGDQEIRAEAAVVRVYPGAMAFQFSRFLDRESFDHLRRLVVLHAASADAASADAAGADADVAESQALPGSGVR